MQGSLKKAELSLKAYVRRPWSCDNITGKKKSKVLNLILFPNMNWDIVCLKLLWDSPCLFFHSFLFFPSQSFFFCSIRQFALFMLS